ncbi:enoyl-CoA hydratase/isomerase family protein [Nitrospirillum viridazoti]|uniref:Enoyl-CoA hydratase n=1 Tax=Nitrospirillum viridazoti CBAmc TaxID=1441467 RepID=A0A248JUT9_9PROT|nr:enoyl-CoA hydratase-related protein [Nitrospirillum amazonense]ASG22241.1 enoyl-CoA hydratase [Nitrospirillum amazonense CBAmc]TWB30993.1 enoyl-CoA hydratase/carnithine racemase [Nitrospirillum amazonense]
MVDYSKYEFLKVEIDGNGVATVTMNDPEKLNAVGPENHKELEYIWVDLAQDESIKAIVLTGAGRAFSAGGDVKKMAARAGTEFGLKYALRVPQNTLRIFEHMLLTPQPVIAAVNGDAIGLGLTLALFCDMSLVADDARLGDTHVKVGLVAGDGGAVVWPLLVGPQRAKEFLMRGKVLKGAEAAALGLINYAHPRETVLEEALKVATEIAANPVWAVRWSKAAVNKQLKAQLNQVLELSIAYESLTMLTHDYKEAATAFAEKRKPTFEGY